MRDLITGDAEGYLTLFLETGSGLHNTGHIQRDSSGILVDIKVNEHSFPFINDWNEDGKKDLITGEFEGQPFDSGSVRVYPNNNTNADPGFKNHMMIRAGGLPVALSNSVPNIFDLDGDSLKDLILSNTNGYVYLYKNTGTNTNPYFEAAYETLKTVNEIYIDAYANSRSHFVDWTGDGDLDLLLGGAEGYVWLCENSTIPNIKEQNKISLHSSLLKITTNPAKNRVHLTYTLKDPVFVTLCVYDVFGERVATLLQHRQNAGKHNIIWNGIDNSSRKISCGIYFINLKTESENITKKVILLN